MWEEEEKKADVKKKKQEKRRREALVTSLHEQGRRALLSRRLERRNEWDKQLA